MRRFDFFREGLRIDAEAMILRGNFDLARKKILHWMVRSVMAEFQLVRLPAKRETADLMAETNSKYRHAAKKFLYVLNCIIHRFWVARAIRKKNSIGVHAKNVFCGSFRGNHAHFAVMIEKQPQNVLLDAEIVGHDAEFSCFRIIPCLAHLLGPR